MGIARTTAAPGPAAACKSASDTPAATDTMNGHRGIDAACARSTARASAGLTQRKTISLWMNTASLSDVAVPPPVSVSNRSRVSADRALPVSSTGVHKPASTAPLAMAVAILPAPINPSLMGPDMTAAGRGWQVGFHLPAGGFRDNFLGIMVALNTLVQPPASAAGFSAEAPARTDLAAAIRRLKKERNAVILAHNYQVGEIQDVADYVGASLGLSYHAQKADADVIVFCGVHFMAETAKIVNPTKTVILPDLDAGCSLSESCPPEKLAAFLENNREKNYYVIAYINCSAGVKALSDVIVTSGNAIKIVEAAPKDRNILFVPDQNLGGWVMEKTGRKMDLWQGNCYVHVEFTRQSIERIRDQYPEAPVVAHPECTFAVRLLADEVCSTEKMISYCRDHEANAFIIVTEAGMLHRLRKEVPGKLFIAGPTDHCACADCRFMKMNTLEKLHDALLNLSPEITMPEETRARAEKPILRMLEQSR